MAHLPFLTLDKGCREAIEWFSTHLDQAGFRVMQTFDFQTARAAHVNCSCPHHGTEDCDCHMVVLLVYESGYPPATIVVHGQDGQSWFMFAASAHSRMDANYETRLQDTLSPYVESIKPDEWLLAA
jgi:hypothetical protein